MVFHPSFTDSPDYIQSLDRGLQVLRAFNRERPRCTLSEVAEHIGFSRAVAQRSYFYLPNPRRWARRGGTAELVISPTPRLCGRARPVFFSDPASTRTGLQLSFFAGPD